MRRHGSAGKAQDEAAVGTLEPVRPPHLHSRVGYASSFSLRAAGAPMLAGAHPDDLDTLGRRLRTAWLGFIRTGTPTTDTPWLQFTADTQAIRRWHR